ncbi:adenylate/guanylate cyclase domain-containing protein [Ovoidimarina sediminis]|uniref:adenylate/guanylate cyclase domain-containing protein n=1 Tax=Ovoidimarina sediminis TaxID=3079856 RepID=UPI002930EACB|nr:adenylate/guanylate cyclase domain-containing protein [Rhodophyticola sp. MJ-SS7]
MADAVGYSSRIEENETKALAALARTRAIIDEVLETHRGTVFSTAGDSVLAEFSSALEATKAALDIQRRLAKVQEETFQLRIGVHFGDVAQQGGTFLGDGVNIAARLEPLAPVGGVLITGVVADQIVGKTDEDFTSIGKQSVKNIARPLELFCWPPEAMRIYRRQRLMRYWPSAFAAALLIAGLSGILFLNGSSDDGMPTGPRIAVLPFDESGTTDEEAFFADGLSRDINAYLSKFSNLFVLSPNSTRQFADADCPKIRNELGADFILSGTVRRGGEDLRVTTIFTDARDCKQLNAPGPFTRDLSAHSVIDLQIEIARKVVAEIGSADAPIFDAKLAQAIEAKSPENLSAYECVLLSYWFYENFDPDRHRRARDCLIGAVQTDPGYSLAWSRLAFSFIESEKYAIDRSDTWAEDSLEAAQRAIDLDAANPDAYYALAIRSQMVGDPASVFANYARKAIELNPNDSFVLADLGTWMAYAGQWETGKDWVTRAKALNPKHQSWWDFIWQLDAYLQGDYASSIEYAQSVNLPGNYMVQAALTAAYAMNGDGEKAEQTLQKVLELKPDYAEDPEQPFRARGMQPELIEKLIEGLERAGLQGGD